jgi:hypothetical protein
MVAIVGCSLLLAAVNTPAYGQEADPVAAAEAAELNATRLRTQTAGSTEAAAAAAASVKAASAATAAAKVLAELAAVIARDAATQAAWSKAADATAAAVKDALAAAGPAAKAAAAASQKVVGELALARAEAAARAAAKAASDAEASAADIEKGLAAVKSATTIAAVRTAGKTAAEAVAKGIDAVTRAANETTAAGAQAARPDQPVTTGHDESILSALRVNITGGSIFFNGNHEIVKVTTDDVVTGRVQSAQFSQASLYLAVESQPRLWAFGSGPANQFHRVYLEPFLNLRLTAIPVSTGGAIQAPDAGFLKSEKAAQLQLGTLLSFNFGSFEVGDSQFHWGLAPVARLMFQSVTDSNRSARVWDLDDDLYHAATFGVRMQLYGKQRRIGDSLRSGWTPVAYLDLSAGQFQNFETAIAAPGPLEEKARECLRDTAKCLGMDEPLPKDAFEASASWARLSIEGRLVLQYVYLGFDLVNGEGPDDLRFIGGLSIKLDRFMRRQ